MKMEIYNIDIPEDPEIINDHQLKFESNSEVKEFVKDILYDDLTLNFDQEILLDTSETSKKNPRLSSASEFQVKVIRISLKSAKVIEYEPNYSDDGNISGYKYILFAQEIKRNGVSFERGGIYKYNKQ
jgi:hypothetical protein